VAHPGGRPTKYRKEYCQDILDFFNVPAYIEIVQKTTDPDGNTTEKPTGKYKPNDLPQFIDFADKIGVSRETLHEWRREHQEFSDAYKKAKGYQQRNWMKCSLLGLYSPAFTIFFGKNIFKWKDKHELEHETGDGLTQLLSRIADSGPPKPPGDDSR